MVQIGWQAREEGTCSATCLLALNDPAGLDPAWIMSATYETEPRFRFMGVDTLSRTCIRVGDV